MPNRHGIQFDPTTTHRRGVQLDQTYGPPHGVFAPTITEFPNGVQLTPPFKARAKQGTRVGASPVAPKST
jgi:hypothetical protein